ncbi:MAG: 16S rRNA (guanine(966)-N(2))-methyltransferase RsmD [Actinomycetota bacterium]|nr:16S rRNA (guanine(966)-N(2))-methyltransferase RsmD [Actinomycetota bacterium]
MTRIVAGAAGGRRLSVPAGREVRPTSDRAREAMFSTLGGLLDLAGAAVLDLYAGSGAVGLEALSRGAARVVLVESDPVAAALIRTNIELVGLPGTHVVRDRVESFLDRPPADGAFDVVFADPPYALDDQDLTAGLVKLDAGWLRPGGIVVVERPTRGGSWAWPVGLAAIKAKRYGDGTLWYGRRS